MERHFSLLYDSPNIKKVYMASKLNFNTEIAYKSFFSLQDNTQIWNKCHWQTELLSLWVSIHSFLPGSDFVFHSWF